MARQRTSTKAAVRKARKPRKDKTNVRDANSFLCKYCSDEFDSEGERYVHAVDKHWKDMLLECEVCAKAFLMGKTPETSHQCALRKDGKTQKTPIPENLSESDVSCSDAVDLGDDFGDDDGDDEDNVALSIISKSLSSEKRGAYVCKYCREICESVIKVLIHQQNHHTSFSECHLCLEQFLSRTSLMQHLESHLQDEWHFCHECGLYYHDEEQLKEHQCPPTQQEQAQPSGSTKTEIKIDQEKTYNCFKCNAQHSTVKALVLHYSNTHPEMKHNSNIHTCRYCLLPFEGEEAYHYHVNNSHPRKHICTTCGKAFVRPCELRVHVKFHLELRDFQCPFCPKAFKRQTHLNCHLTIHTGERPYTCSICGKSFKAKRTLLGHESTHSGNEPYQCKVCGLKFTLKSSLLKHEELHTQEGQRVKCQKCNKDFSSLSTLAVHEKSVHQKIKRCVCETCGAAFTFKSHLRKHLMVHNGEKPLKCRYCDKYFRVNYSRALHERQHTGTKPFSCDVCGKNYATKNRLDRHVKIHSKHFQKNELETEASSQVQILPPEMQVASEIIPQTNIIHKDLFQKEYSTLTPLDKNFEQTHFFLPSMTNHYSINGFQCHLCGLLCHSQEELIRHQQNHPVTPLEPRNALINDTSKYPTAETVGVMLSFINNVHDTS